MGADLYILKFHDAARAEHQPKFDAACRERDVAWEKAGMGRYRSSPNVVPTLSQRAEWAVKAETAQKVVDAEYDAMHGESYFRDSYNASCLLQYMGLSWWQDVVPMLNSKGNLTLPKLREFLKMLEEHPVNITLKALRHTLVTNNATIDRGENSPRAWRDHFIQRRLELIAFVKLARKRRNVIHCSL